MGGTYPLIPSLSIQHGSAAPTALQKLDIVVVLRLAPNLNGVVHVFDETRSLRSVSISIDMDRYVEHLSGLIVDGMLSKFTSPISDALEHLSISGGNQYGTAEVTADCLSKFIDLHSRSLKKLSLSKLIFVPMDFPKVIDYAKGNLRLNKLSFSRMCITLEENRRLFWELLTSHELEFGALDNLHSLHLEGEDCQVSLPSTTHCWRVSSRVLSSGDGWSMKNRWLISQCLRLSPDMVDAREQMYRDDTTFTGEAGTAGEIQEQEEEQPIEEEFWGHEEEEQNTEIIDENESEALPSVCNSAYEYSQYDIFSELHRLAPSTELDSRTHFAQYTFGGNGNNADFVVDNSRVPRQHSYFQQIEDQVSQRTNHFSTMYMNPGGCDGLLSYGMGAFDDVGQRDDHGISPNQHHRAFELLGRGVHQENVPAPSLYDYNLGTHSPQHGSALEGPLGHSAGFNAQALWPERFLQPSRNPVYQPMTHMNTVGYSWPFDLVENGLDSFDFSKDHSLGQYLEKSNFYVPGGGSNNFHLPANNHQFLRDGADNRLAPDYMTAAAGTRFSQHDGLLYRGAPRFETMAAPEVFGSSRRLLNNMGASNFCSLPASQAYGQFIGHMPREGTGFQTLRPQLDSIRLVAATSSCCCCCCSRP